MADNSDFTDNLNLPYLMANQAQKHVTVNEALIALDAHAHLTILEENLNTPPSEPAEGTCYLIGSNPTGLWEEQAGKVAHYCGGWRFYEPKIGWRYCLAGDLSFAVFDGTQWIKEDTAFDQLGINTLADTTNRLSVRSSNSLFTADGGDHRMAINKDSDEATASIVFQNQYSGRTEFGLVGDDGFSIKTSADGVNWRTSLHIDPASGDLEFPGSLVPVGDLNNLMADGGRFAGSPEPSSLLISTFEIPTWCTVWATSTMTEHARMIRNSQTYGGTASALDPDLIQLLESLMSPAFRRYYPEFNIARVETSLSVTGSTVLFPDGVNRYIATSNRRVPQPLRSTFSFYVKSKQGQAGIHNSTVRRLFLDGAPVGGHIVVPDDDAWHHIVIHEGFDLQTNYRFSYYGIRLYQEAGGSSLIAFPALLSGHVDLPTNIGQIPHVQKW